MKKSSVSTKQTLKIMWRYANNYRLGFYGGVIGTVLAVISQTIIPPFIIAKMFGTLQYLNARHQPLQFNTFKNYFIGYSVAMLAGVFFWRLQTYLIWLLEVKVRRDMYNDIFNHLHIQSQRFYADRFGGSLVSQTSKFIYAFEKLMDDFIWNIIPSLSVLIFSLIVLAFIYPYYALILLIIIILYIGIMYKRIVKTLPLNVLESEHQSKITGELSDSITNSGTIRAFAGEQYEADRFHNSSDKLYQAGYNLSIGMFKTDATSHTMTNGFQIISVLFGLIAITQFKANISVLYLLISYTQATTNQLWLFSRIIRNVSKSLGDSVEMTKILLIAPEVKNPIKPELCHISRGSIEFRQVSFGYKDNNNLLFKNLSFKIKPGEKVGLVGPSGGGKTTITSLILRFSDINSGHITIDNQDITKISQQDLRSKIAYVAQEPILFHRSLKDNIQYGNLQTSNREIEAVAKMAHAYDFITDLPNKFNTLVGERGVKLSGGQRQRIVIARALLKNAPILVLDEATSALDSESEALIQDALWKLMANKTAIIIAHRLSTIQKMDRIIVLQNGRIVEEGSHKELLHINGSYAKLWQHQSGGFMED